MAISEKVELLGKEYYAASKMGIPAEITLSAMPTVSELEFVTAEDFDQTMIESVLPQVINEKFDYKQLLEVDYSWVLRCLRILNYGPYFTTNAIYCNRCGRIPGEFQCNLMNIECKPLPDKFNNKFMISKDEFLDFNQNIEFHMLTINEVMAAYKDNVFNRPNGMINREYARMCYMIRTIGTDQNISPVEVKMKLEKEMSSADFIILKDKISTMANFGLRAGGDCVCLKCGDKHATFIALVDDRFFRPTMGDLRTWKADRSRRADENTTGNKAEDVRKHH